MITCLLLMMLTVIKGNWLEMLKRLILQNMQMKLLELAPKCPKFSKIKVLKKCVITSTGPTLKVLNLNHLSRPILVNLLKKHKLYAYKLERILPKNTILLKSEH